jgi:glyoxylase I family protein
MIERIHHVAYRCKDAKKTVDFYSRYLKMKFTMAISENRVPSTGEEHPYMHIFLHAGQGSMLAFFELPHQLEMGRDQNTPFWVQHIAFEVKSRAELESTQAHLVADGIEVLGPIDHKIFQSIYFNDPSGHRIEIAYNTGTQAEYSELERVAPLMLEEWTQTKIVPQHSSWLHNHS